MKPKNRNGRRAERQSQTQERQATYVALSTDEKIARARKAPGRSRRQLRRLGVAA